MPKQIGTIDITVSIYIAPDYSDRDDKGVRLDKRWDLEKSPFFQTLQKDESRNRDLSVIRYPRNGDVSRLIFVPALNARLEITCEKTTENPAEIHIQAACGRIYREIGEGFHSFDTTRNELVNALIEDGWSIY